MSVMLILIYGRIIAMVILELLNIHFVYCYSDNNHHFDCNQLTEFMFNFAAMGYSTSVKINV